MKKITLIITAILGFAAGSSSFAQESLTLDGYLAQVSANNAEIMEADYSMSASEKKVLEMDMAYSPYFSGSVNYMDDKSGTEFGSTLPVDEMKALALDISLAKNFSTGSSLAFGYSDSRAKFNLSYPYMLFIGMPAVSNFTGYEIKPYLRVEQSLLKEFGAGLTSSGINKAKKAARAGRYFQLLKKQQIYIKARQAYLALALTREVVEFRKASLSRAEEIMEWNKNKYKIDLADKGDLLQAQAAYKMRQLSLQMSLEDETNACRDFNELRGGSFETVGEQLEKLLELGRYYASTGTLARTGRRADALAAKELLDSAKFAETEARRRSGPELSAFGIASLPGLDLNYSDAVKQITGADKPAYALGLSFSSPFDLGTVKDVRKGYGLDSDSAAESLKKAELSELNDWNELIKTWNNVKSRLQSAVEIREIQNERVAAEKEKFKRGRTTTFQLLAAQNDLDDSIISVYRLIMEEFMVFSQAELYNTKPFKE